jgi:phage terminase large subunit GpA-like protein
VIEAIFLELLSERLATKHSKGYAKTRMDQKPERENEALDCRVYALSALGDSERQELWTSWTNKINEIEEPPPPVPEVDETTNAKKTAFVCRKRSWINGF